MLAAATPAPPRTLLLFTRVNPPTSVTAISALSLTTATTLTRARIITVLLATLVLRGTPALSRITFESR